MRITHLLLRVAFAALLSACATQAPLPKPPPTMASMLATADAAVKAGKNDIALAWLTAAIAAFPGDKAPQLRTAQVQFDCHNYGEAIAHAQRVLVHDPDDRLALSIAAVSGLRVSSKALTDLAAKNNLIGPVRAEAQDLVKLLRANIGGPIMLAPVRPVPEAKAPAIVGIPKPVSGAVLADWLTQ